MAEYSTLKVPELKKILGERGLTLSGNKADLIARLEEDDGKKVPAATAAPAEDEIDWDEDEKPTTEPAVPAAAPAPAPAPAAVEKAKPIAEAPKVISPPVTTSAPTTAPAVTSPASAAAAATTETKSASTEPEKPKQDFSIGLPKTDLEKEIEKREARSKKYNIPFSAESKILAERAKKFGLVGKETEKVSALLDSALPDGRSRGGKRGREGEERDGGRNAKRQTPDRRGEPKKNVGGGRGGERGGERMTAPKGNAGSSSAPKKFSGKITDDPVEREKAEKRAARFRKPATTA